MIKSPSPSNNENDLLIMSEDFKIRIEKKNEKLSKLYKIIFQLYGLIRRGLETDEYALFEESRSVISEFLQEEFDI